MAKNTKKKKLNSRNISYLNRDFESFRNELVRYSRTHYGESILDFSEASIAGMFVDMAAYIGDIMSYYQDHQFNELSLETAVEDQNIERLIRDAGVKIHGSSPAFAEVDITIRVDALTNIDGITKPNANLLPVVKSGTIVASSAGIEFELLENIDFGELDEIGELVASYEIATVDSDSVPLDFFVTKTGMFTSAKTVIETLSVGDDFVPFRTFTLKTPDVNEIIRVTDSDGEYYYEVENLTQDTVYIKQPNTLPDYLSVPSRLKMIPAPRRFEKSTDRKTAKTTLRFGSGNEDVFDEDIVPDPSEHAVKMFGDKKTLDFLTIDPNSFLTTSTLGVSPRNTTLTIVYRAGGSVRHNVVAGQINSVKSLITKFKDATPSTKVSTIRSTTTCVNKNSASGGEEQPTLNEFRQIALSSRNAQGRIVTKEDLLSRVYSLPNRFGRIFRAGVRDNPTNPFSSYLYVVSRDSEGKLKHSSDTLKENISEYLESYRLITDAIELVDGMIINIGINYEVSVSSDYNTTIALQTVNNALQEYFDIRNFQFDQPIILSDLQNIILNTDGIMSLLLLDVVNLSGVVESNSYSSEAYEPLRYLDRGIIYPPKGSIFEVKFPNDDIKGRVV